MKVLKMIFQFLSGHTDVREVACDEVDVVFIVTSAHPSYW
jgi:hypothetical protein